MAYNLMDLRRRIIASQPHIITKSGDIVTFDTPISRPLKSLILSLSPIQSGSGDPSPDNIRPIYGHTSASLVGTGNLINEATNVVGKYINTSGAVMNTVYYQYTDLIPVTVGKTYKLQVKNTATGIAYATARAVSAYDENGTFIDRIASVQVSIANQGKPASVEVTIPSGVTHVRLNYCIGDIGCAFSDQYYSHTATIPTPPGTVYGGEIDWVNGVLKVTHAIVTYTGASGENWKFSTSNNKNRVYITNLVGICDYTGEFIGNYIKGIQNVLYPDEWYTFPNANSFIIGVPASITSANDFKTYLSTNNLTICYTLATPIEYNLSDLPEIETLKGVNNVWVTNDGGEIKVLKAWGY